MSDLLDSILNQIRACEANPGSLLPATSGNIGAYVTCDGEWDIFLFVTPGVQTSAPQEIVNGLWKFSHEISIEEEQNQFTALRTTRQNRLHFSGFIADLIEKLDTMDFAEALKLTLAEWRSRWRMRATDLSFIQRVGIFGELVVLRDFIVSNGVNDTEIWVANEQGQGLHDFSLGPQIFEVKSTTRAGAEIHIFDEAQLHHRDGLFLLLVKLEISGAGQSIDELANEILSHLDSSESKENFLLKLDRSGFTFGKYGEDRFIVRSRFFWESTLESPFIQLEDIDREIRSPRNINYNVLEESVPFTEINNFGTLLYNQIDS